MSETESGVGLCDLGACWEPAVATCGYCLAPICAAHLALGDPPACLDCVEARE